MIPTLQLASERYLPRTPFLTKVDEISRGRQYLIFLSDKDYGPRIEVFQGILHSGQLDECEISFYECTTLCFADAVNIDAMLTNAVITANIWNLDTGKNRNKVWGR